MLLKPLLAFYGDCILPRMVSWGMSGERFRELRQEALADVRGRVLELGFGSGLNLPHYPGGVTEVLGLDPAHLGRRLGRKRIAAATFPVGFVELEGTRFAMDERSVDAVVTTFTLCTIDELSTALREAARVLVPGGRLHYLEHGLAPEPGVARWQRRLNPLQMRLFGGCRLDRKIDDELRAAGFQLEAPRGFYMKGPRTHSYLYAGTAVCPEAS